MTAVPRHGDIEIDQDPAFQRRDWRAQSVGRIVMVVIVIAALAGAFGDGVLSSRRARTDDGRLEVEYDRIARHGAPEPLRVHVAAHAPGDSIVDLWIDQRYVHGVVMREISPSPIATWAGGERLIYRFRLTDLPRTAVIVFQADANDLWSRSGAVGLLRGDSVRFRQFVLP
jgi:hypothetical protein